jgi:hypothetical protein
MVVCSPQLIIRIGEHTQNWELRDRTGVVVANGHKSQAVKFEYPHRRTESLSGRIRLENLSPHPGCRVRGFGGMPLWTAPKATPDASRNKAYRKTRCVRLRDLQQLRANTQIVRRPLRRDAKERTVLGSVSCKQKRSSGVTRTQTSELLTLSKSDLVRAGRGLNARQRWY